MDSNDFKRLKFEDGGFLIIVVLVTLAFGWLLVPFFGATLWGLVAAILFSPLYRGILSGMPNRPSTAAALTLLIILALVIVPAILLSVAVVGEASTLYSQIKLGEIDFAEVFNRLRDALPRWAKRLLESAGATDFDAASRMVTSNVAAGLDNVASQALNFGQGALRLLGSLGVMLYLIFFLLRDGEAMGNKIKRAVPLRPALRDELVRHFIVVVRATMKGTVVVAIMQGIVGGLIFWALGIEAPLIWGLLMGFFSLVPAVGTGLVWVPVAIYLLVTGSVMEGAILVFCGLFVIGLIDNLLRPILVGRDTRMPDFVVLIATLAGIQLFGLNGFIVGPMIAALFIAVWTIIAEARGAGELIE